MATYYVGTLYRKTTGHQAKVITVKGMQIEIVTFFVDLSDCAGCECLVLSCETPVGKTPLHSLAAARERTLFFYGQFFKMFLHLQCSFPF